MLPILLAVALILTPTIRADGPGPDTETVNAVLKALTASKRMGEASDRVAAVRAAGSVIHPRVAKAIGKRVSDSHKDVQSTVLETLRYYDHPAGLKELHGIHQRSQKQLAESELLPMLYRAIGQHADPDSLQYVGRDLFSSRAPGVTRSRILALGRIRDKRTVDLIIDSMRKSDTQTAERFLGNLRLSLMALTGVDRGRSVQAWEKWWEDSRSEFQMSPKLPPMPRTEYANWTSYWGIDVEKPRGRRREDRGRR